MNLHQKLSTMHNEKLIADFKRKHPEVYDWFHGDDFSDRMVENGGCFLRWTANTHFHLEALPVKELPSYDSSGVVNIHEVLMYLHAEGFSSKIEYDDGGIGFLTLVIKLK